LELSEKPAAVGMAGLEGVKGVEKDTGVHRI
jgi:hypothetical protein